LASATDAQLRRFDPRARGATPTRARGQQSPEMVKAAYPHGVVLKVPPRTGFGELLNVLHRTAQ
jgi:hypothetical protein